MAFLSILTSFLSAAALLVAAIPYDNTTDCNLKFAVNGKISKAAYDYTLQHWVLDTDTPTEVNGVKTHVNHFNNVPGWVDDEPPEILLTAAREALTEAISVYSVLATVPEVYLFVVRNNFSTNYTDSGIYVAGEPCRVRAIYKKMARQSLTVNKQTIAHEFGTASNITSLHLKLSRLATASQRTIGGLKVGTTSSAPLFIKMSTTNELLSMVPSFSAIIQAHVCCICVSGMGLQQPGCRHFEIWK